MINLKHSVLLSLIVVLLFACSEETVQSPRPKGYMRIDFPEKSYLKHEPSCPYSFEFPLRSLIDTNLSRVKNPCWLNIYYPQYGATMHFTYTPIKRDSLFQYIEDARKLAMKHTVRADDINERYYEERSAQCLRNCV